MKEKCAAGSPSFYKNDVKKENEHWWVVFVDNILRGSLFGHWSLPENGTIRDEIKQDILKMYKKAVWCVDNSQFYHSWYKNFCFFAADTGHSQGTMSTQ